MPVAQKHRTISRQEKMAFSTPFGLFWDSPPPPTEPVRTEGCTDGRSRDYYVRTEISWIDGLPNFLSNGALLAGKGPQAPLQKAVVAEDFLNLVR